jgi:hypothetical protein
MSLRPLPQWVLIHLDYEDSDNCSEPVTLMLVANPTSLCAGVVRTRSTDDGDLEKLTDRRCCSKLLAHARDVCRLPAVLYFRRAPRLNQHIR